MKNPFDYAHERWRDIVWMSQNTNQLVNHPAIIEAMRETVESAGRQ